VAAPAQFHFQDEVTGVQYSERRKISEPNMLDPTPELPDDTPLEQVDLPPRIRTALEAAGMKTVGQVRDAPDETLLGLQDVGKASVAHLRETLGLPSTEGVRPSSK
jgi:DNA-directed RNA polymerase alpha subunit